MRKALDNPAIRLLVIPIVIGMTLFLLQRMFNASSNVHARLTFNELPIAGVIESEMAEVRLAVRSHRQKLITQLKDQSIAAIDSLELQGMDQKEAAIAQKAQLRDKFRSALEDEPVASDPEMFWLLPVLGDHGQRLPKSVYVGTVSNDGSRTATGVRIESDSIKAVTVGRRGQVPTNRAVDGVIELGDLRPAESVDVLLWSEYPRHFTLDRLTVLHDHGAGTVSLNVVGPQFWAEFPRRWLPIVWLMVIPVAIGAAIGILSMIRPAAPHNHGGEDADDADTSTQ